LACFSRFADRRAPRRLDKLQTCLNAGGTDSPRERRDRPVMP